MPARQGTLQPSFRVLCELPRALQSTVIGNCDPEYPTAVFLTSSTVLVTDGHGSMYLLRISNAELAGPCMLSTIRDKSIPFRIHDAIMVSPDMAVALLSSRTHFDNEEAGSSTLHSHTKHVPSQFDIWAVQLHLTLPLPPKMDVLWRRRGSDAPIFVRCNAVKGTHLIVSGSPYRDLDVPTTVPCEPTADEFVSIPQHVEVLEAGMPPPYSWSQTSEMVTVAFPLPSTTIKSDIQVVFSPRSLTIQVSVVAPSLIPLPRYCGKDLWDGISASSSYWTWDRDAEHSFGLLTLHLDKQHEGRKWMHVFAKAGTTAASEASPEDIDVPETLDPSELCTIRESLEKYTSSLLDGQCGSGIGLGTGSSSLAEGEMDLEIDDFVGMEAFMTWINEDGSTPPWAAKSEGPTTILSTPLPGLDKTNTSFVIKTAHDGAFFTLRPAITAGSAPEWTHISTYCALAFVLASKQDTRFVHHASSDAVLAFESCSRNHGGNVYIYYGHDGKVKWAKQSVLKTVDPGAGALLGVGALEVAEGRMLILNLCENELTLIHNFL